ncbi:MAG: hypothetical protein Q9184_001659 [Pyrenodesmia sp. 2 TL-2023]
MRQIALAVVGTPRSGKSTFVQHALDLKKLPTSKVSAKKVSLEGIVSTLRIHEIDTHEIGITSQGTPCWPLVDDDENASNVDGVLIIYSISDLDSTKPIPALLNVTVTFDLSSRARGTCEVDHLGAPSLPAVQEVRNKHQLTKSGFTELPLAVDAVGLPGEHGCVEENINASPTQSLGGLAEYNTGARTDENVRSPSREARGIQSSSKDNALRLSANFDDSGSGTSPKGSNPIDRNGLITLDSNQKTKPVVESTPKGGALRKSVHGDQGGGLAFDELVDRLLSQATSKVDAKFVAIFLCLYRQFSAPSALLCAVISRFEQVNVINPQAVRLTTQLRYLSILATWVSEYPGDFAHPSTRMKMTEFMSALAGQRQFSMAVKDIRLHLDVVSEDDDTHWACSDATMSMINLTGRHLTRSSVQNVSPTPTEDAVSGVAADDVRSDGKVSHATERGSDTLPIASSAGISSSRSNLPLHIPLKSIDSAQSQARLTVTPRASLGKVHWHFFMEIPDEDVARELTRIDWALFSTIRPRDLIRHVSLSEEDKAKCRNLKSVKRMIDQFNHTAFWIANIILLRDKPKHRARALEKCMSVAWKLRQLNNYNALGAVVAGINGTAVHRLSQTRELVPHHVQKQFMRLEILMGTQKSHFPYRLAWSNTTSERIPFLPLHCRDLASAGEGNLTYLGEERNRVNWKKFEVLGEIIVSIQRSQSGPYTGIVRNGSLQRLIQDVGFTNDEDVSNPKKPLRICEPQMA